ncbi:unnamed protein product [Protopolystoma xenopodis]|uniref:Uncharacterized protein n=1 Tax=Protopolystoma xenopodis TaxID=117903 RepID=A0A3S5ALD0_9PLAT|nr:unnamed protein product [Protopolystoma xenopodis]
MVKNVFLLYRPRPDGKCSVDVDPSATVQDRFLYPGALRMHLDEFLGQAEDNLSTNSFIKLGWLPFGRKLALISFHTMARDSDERKY